MRQQTLTDEQLLFVTQVQPDWLKLKTTKFALQCDSEAMLSETEVMLS